MTVQATNRKVTIPIWVLTLILGLVSATLGWAIKDRIIVEGEKATLQAVMEQVVSRLTKVEEKVDKIYELNYRRTDR